MPGCFLAGPGTYEMKVILAMVLMFSGYAFAGCGNIDDHDQRAYCNARESGSSCGNIDNHDLRAACNAELEAVPAATLMIMTSVPIAMPSRAAAVAATSIIMTCVRDATRRRVAVPAATLMTMTSAPTAMPPPAAVVAGISTIMTSASSVSPRSADWGHRRGWVGSTCIAFCRDVLRRS